MIDACRQLILDEKFEEAERLLNQASESPGIPTLLGIVYLKTGRIEQASERFQQVLAQTPRNGEALLWMALLQKQERGPKEAIPYLGALLDVQLDSEVLTLLGTCQLEIGQLVQAEASFRAANATLRSGATYSNLGMALRLLNRGEEALKAFQKAVAYEPEPRNYLQLFKQFQQLGRWDEAVEILEKGLQLHPASLPLSEALAVTLGRLGRNEEAERIFGEIALLSTSAANSYADWLSEQGRFTDAVPVLAESLRINPSQGWPYRSLVEAKQFIFDGAPIIEEIHRLRSEPSLDDSAQMHLSYALGKLYEHDKEFESAMRAFDEANSIAYRTYPACRTFDPAWTQREPELIAEIYSKDFFQRVSALWTSDTRPIFIVGMIRSGTTLLDQIVSSHPEVASGGEGTFWNTEADAIHPRWRNADPDASEIAALPDRYLRTVIADRQKPRFTDKMPLNYRNLGPIHAVFPRAKILHLRRNPVDTCLSIYSTFFAGGPSFAYNKKNIAAFYRAYLRAMEHWRQTLPADRFLELDYESLVTDPESVTRKVIEFCDLPWDDACLRHEGNPSAISTPSRWQARQPIYRSSLGRGRQYEPWLGEFAELRID